METYGQNKKKLSIGRRMIRIRGKVMRTGERGRGGKINVENKIKSKERKKGQKKGRSL